MKKFILTVLIIVVALLIGWGLVSMSHCGEKNALPEKATMKSSKELDLLNRKISSAELRMAKAIMDRVAEINWLEKSKNSQHRITLVFDESGCYHVKRGDVLSRLCQAVTGKSSIWPEVREWHFRNGIGQMPKVVWRNGKAIVNLKIGSHIWFSRWIVPPPASGCAGQVYVAHYGDVIARKSGPDWEKLLEANPDLNYRAVVDPDGRVLIPLRPTLGDSVCIPNGMTVGNVVTSSLTYDPYSAGKTVEYAALVR